MYLSIQSTRIYYGHNQGRSTKFWPYAQAVAMGHLKLEVNYLQLHLIHQSTDAFTQNSSIYIS